jgi:hypothetical protein
MSTLNDVLSNPALQAGIGILTKTRPEIGLALRLVSSLLSGWNEQHELNAAIKVIDDMAAEHVKRLATQKLHPIEQNEIEIRLHELLTVLVKLGGLS